jgi:hypothetical protein
MPQKDTLVRLRTDRANKLQQVAEILAKKHGRRVIEKPEAIEKLCDYYLEHEA